MTDANAVVHSPRGAVMAAEDRDLGCSLAVAVGAFAFALAVIAIIFASFGLGEKVFR